MEINYIIIYVIAVIVTSLDFKVLIMDVIIFVNMDVIMVEITITHIVVA